jgi:uncharacterized membrane protein
LSDLPAPLAVKRLTQRRTLGLLAAAGGLGFFLLAYPMVAERMVSALGVRAAAAAFLALAAASVLRRAGGPWADLSPSGWTRAGLVGLLALAVLTGRPVALWLIPAWIQLALAAICARTLRHPPSLIERAGRFLQPYLPDFVAPYCRSVTALFTMWFAANAVAIACLALWAPLETWRAYSGFWMYAAIVLLIAIEYVVRKIWFRHYGDNAVDRVWARLLPQEGSARGRRTRAYVQEVRRRLTAEQGQP